MELRDLRTFVQVTGARSITAAASELNLVQSAVSQAVARLERELDVRLLERSPHGVRPTDAGADLSRRAAEILARASEAELAMAAYRDVASGRVRLGLLPSVVPLLLSSLLRGLRDRCPKLAVDVDEGLAEDLMARLREDRLDVAMVWGSVELRGLETGHLSDVPLYLVTAVDHRLVDAEVTAIGALREDSWITFPKGGPGHRWIEAACEQAGFAPRIAAELASLAEIKAYVQARMGVTLLPIEAVKDELATGSLLAIALEPPSPAAALSYVKRRAAGAAPADHVVELTRELLSGERES